MTIALKRAYDPPARSDGCRVLVERLWPRGVRKEDLKIDLWAKDAAPSTELRRWFGHDADRWSEFKRRYRAELGSRPGALDALRERLRLHDTVTFVFAAKETRFNNAVALKEILEGATGVRQT